MSRAPFNVLVLPFRRREAERAEYAIFRRADQGYWQVIAGGGEDEEPPLAAAKREAFEEAAIPSSASFFSLRTSSSIPVYHFSAHQGWPRDQYVIPGYYFCVDASGITVTLSNEHTEFRWVSEDEGRELLHWQSDGVALWELNERLRNGDLPLAL